MIRQSAVLELLTKCNVMWIPGGFDPFTHHNQKSETLQNVTDHSIPISISIKSHLDPDTL